MENTLANEFAFTILQIKNCRNSKNHEFLNIAEQRLSRLTKDFIESGPIESVYCSIDDSSLEKIVFHVTFHHMNDLGYYCGYTEHKVTIRQTFIGLCVTVSGQNKRDCKIYIADVFDNALSSQYVLSSKEREVV